MTKEQLLDLHDQLCEQAKALMGPKNQDYTAGSDDPFANLKAAEALGIRPELGVLIRCLDKFARLRAFVENGSLAVKDEAALDSCLDVINYMVLFVGLTQSRRGCQWE